MKVGFIFFLVLNKEDIITNFIADSRGNLCCSSKALLRKLVRPVTAQGCDNGAQPERHPE